MDNSSFPPSFSKKELGDDFLIDWTGLIVCSEIAWVLSSYQGVGKFFPINSIVMLLNVGLPAPNPGSIFLKQEKWRKKCFFLARQFQQVVLVVSYSRKNTKLIRIGSFAYVRFVDGWIDLNSLQWNCVTYDFMPKFLFSEFWLSFEFH